MNSTISDDRIRCICGGRGIIAVDRSDKDAAPLHDVLCSRKGCGCKTPKYPDANKAWLAWAYMQESLAAMAAMAAVEKTP